jgi:hypothetical protein
MESADVYLQHSMNVAPEKNVIVQCVTHKPPCTASVAMSTFVPSWLSEDGKHAGKRFTQVRYLFPLLNEFDLVKKDAEDVPIRPIHRCYIITSKVAPRRFPYKNY